MIKIRKIALLGIVLPLALLGLYSCSPVIRIAAPEKPIVINLNVKVHQEVRIKVERDISKLFEAKPDIF